ncbi:MAG: DUF5906 domain-containing protein [Thermoguttaceae bacterium]|nr:DUF5906 domain-containing protein [Thermoguttaceae bacterium]
MTKAEFVFNNIDLSGDINACTLLWLEDNGWYRPSVNGDGARQEPFRTAARAGQALGAGNEMRFRKNEETIDVSFDPESQEPVFLLNGEAVPNAKELLRNLAGVEAALTYLTAKLELNAWGFRPSDKETCGPTERRGFYIAAALKKHYTVFRRWKRKVDTVTDDCQLCRWDFQSGTYRAVDEDWVHEACKDIVPETPMKVAREAYKQLRNDASIPIVTELYNDGLPVANGDMRIFTGELEDPTPEHFVVSRLRAGWYGERHHPAVDTLFSGIEDEIDRQAFKTYLGYALTPGCELRKMMLLYGNPRSGKSTLCNAITKGVIGMDSVKVFNLNQDFSDGDTGRFGLQGWEGAILAYCDEIGSGRIPDSGPLKSVVAGEPLAVDRKGKAKVSVILTPKILMCTNHIPNFQDTSSAVLDRLIPIDMSREPFTSGEFNQVVFKDPEFGSAMLWELVHAIQEFATRDDAGNWIIKGEIPISERSQELLDTAREKSNPIVAVFKRWLEEDGENVIGASWTTFKDTRFEALYKDTIGLEPDMKKSGQILTVDATLKNTIIVNPVTGNEERYQIVKQYPLRTGDTVRTACGFVARFSHDRNENRKFVRDAAEKFLANKGGGNVTILKLDAGLDYNSELVL